MTNVRVVQAIAWGVSAFAVSMAVIAWGETYGWQLAGIDIYVVFPLLGLLAFSLMWGHYVTGAVRRYFGVEKAALKLYFEVTSMIVLVAILLHPGLLAWQLWLDGFGLPPASELNYVAPALRNAVLLGFISLSIFLSFELRRLFEARKWWKYVEYASDAAMVLIFIHALRLGGALQLGWFRIIWFFYGFSLLASYIYIQMQKSNQPLPK